MAFSVSVVLSQVLAILLLVGRLRFDSHGVFLVWFGPGFVMFCALCPAQYVVISPSRGKRTREMVPYLILLLFVYGDLASVILHILLCLFS